MTKEIRTWIIVILLTAFIAVLCPDPSNLFERSSNFKYVLFTLCLLLHFSSFWKSCIIIFSENKGMLSWKKFKGLLYFYYFILIFFMADQIGYLIRTIIYK